MNSTSSQDEFAKWAKARRRHDKTMEEYEALSTCHYYKTTGDVVISVEQTANTLVSRQDPHL